MFSFDPIEFVYEPYPIGLARPVLPPAHYVQLVNNWPALKLFQYKPELGHKYSLSEVNNADHYHAFIREHALWREFHAAIKSRAFLEQILTALRRHNIELGLERFDLLTGEVGWKRGATKRLRAAVGALRGAVAPQLSARFEFSMLPAAGGCIRPHTDAPSKIITLVFSMIGQDEWNPAFGGGTEVLRPKDSSKNFNFINRSLDFGEVECLSEFPFQPNQCVIFVKTFNSWHSVQPMTGTDTSLMRRTLTVNIERHN